MTSPQPPLVTDTAYRDPNVGRVATLTQENDLCAKCGALDLDHTVEECARRWAEQHPGAAAGIVGAERAPRESA